MALFKVHNISKKQIKRSKHTTNNRPWPNWNSWFNFIQGFITWLLWVHRQVFAKIFRISDSLRNPSVWKEEGGGVGVVFDPAINWRRGHKQFVKGKKEPKRMEPEDTNGLKLLLVEIYTGISERHLDHDNDSCNYGEDDMTLEMVIMIDLVVAGGRLSCFPPSTAWRSSSGASAAKSIIAISSSSSDIITIIIAISSSSSSLGQSRPTAGKA